MLSAASYRRASFAPREAPSVSPDLLPPSLGSKPSPGWAASGAGIGSAVVGAVIRQLQMELGQRKREKKC